MTAEPNSLRRYNLRPRPTTGNRHISIVKCSSKKQRKLELPFLSSDIIIFHILVYLPADILHNVVRYVCRDWYNILSTPQFILAHLKNTERGLLLNQFSSKFKINYIQDSLKTTNNDDDTYRRLQVVEVLDKKHQDYRMSTTCNGLVVIYNPRKNYIPHLVNLVTSESVTLPPAAATIHGQRFSCLGCTRFSKKYKLVELYGNRRLPVECWILTIGVNTKWRSLFQLPMDKSFENFGHGDFFHCDLVVCAEGILHVIHPTLPLVLNIDLETETIYTCATPKPPKRNTTTYVGNGRSLYMMDNLGIFSWELWLLKDAETGEWTKLATIDLGRHKTMLRSTLFPTACFIPLPVGFLKDGEVVAFYVADGFVTWAYNSVICPSRNCITYNVKTGCINSFHLDEDHFEMDMTFNYISYVKSLVSPISVACS